jgi:hypothetical protein
MLTSKCSKRPLKVMVKIIETNNINLLGFTFKDNIFEWGENYVENHPNCNFEKL